MARIRHLRVRIKELASEAAHIRHEEHQCSGMEKWHLQHHRTSVVRPAARHAQLAYACLRGKTYDQVEPTIRCDARRIMAARRAIEEAAKIAARFGGDPKAIERWKEHALLHVDVQTRIWAAQGRAA